MDGTTLLKTYRDEMKFTDAQLAKLLGVSASLVCWWWKGERTPGLGTAFAIERITNGRVPAVSWVSPHESKKAPAAPKCNGSKRVRPSGRGGRAA